MTTTDSATPQISPASSVEVSSPCTKKTISKTTTKSSINNDNPQEEVHRISDTTKTKPKKSKSGLILRSFLRLMFVDLPVMLLFAIYAAFIVLGTVHDEILAPQLELMRWTLDRAEMETTYFHRDCEKEDVTTDNVEDLIIANGTSTKEAVEHMLTHGASIYPNILSENTAKEVRAFIVEQNLKQESFYIIEGEHRYSFGISVDQHPSIPKALHEIASHPVLRPVLEELVGRNPAVIEFTAITSAYGAVDQFWHQDVVPEGSAAKYARTFVPSYSLFIPVQDVHRNMGSTEVCGNHREWKK